LRVIPSGRTALFRPGRTRGSFPNGDASRSLLADARRTFPFRPLAREYGGAQSSVCGLQRTGTGSGREVWDRERRSANWVLDWVAKHSGQGAQARFGLCRWFLRPCARVVRAGASSDPDALRKLDECGSVRGTGGGNDPLEQEYVGLLAGRGGAPCLARQ